MRTVISMLIKDLFEIFYPRRITFAKMQIDNNGINFVSTRGGNNGVVAKVQKQDGINIYPAGIITVPLKGTVLEAHVQAEKCYVESEVAVLIPRKKMCLKEKIYYCTCIQKNKYRYSFGRQANLTISDIELPNDIPSWVYTSEIHYPHTKINNLPELIDTTNWKWFNYETIFDIRCGFYNKKPQKLDICTQRDIPFISSTDSNNGITGYYSTEEIQMSSKTGQSPNQDISQKIFNGNCITLSNNGSVGYAFYQEHNFTCSHDVTPLYLKDYPLNQYIAMFICTLIEMERYRWNYGRKWRPIRMPQSKIKLPVTDNGRPDWQYMENYIKSLPYGDCI